jgi:hypothetical protein
MRTIGAYDHLSFQSRQSAIALLEIDSAALQAKRRRPKNKTSPLLLSPPNQSLVETIAVNGVSRHLDVLYRAIGEIGSHIEDLLNDKMTAHLRFA